ncbi:hypothetical protein ASD12_18195 [Mesorhizobium sp. Root102]|uniref:hypothetical protein n=1 Tax=Mesorhizobium sp. Root102 TaxID=1736422 RepID=UPI0006FD9DD4|nr:hypothetical protein [Mesorhizobium sp. Root102]KQU77731.1 hypothetical protein ASD12_18195 [Mesorhizobium sp. Root102]
MQRQPVRSFIGTLAVSGLLAGLVLAGTHGRAWPHDAPTGWAYPIGCCSGIDCREVNDADIVEGARGYEIRKTGELIPMTDPKVRQSPDGRFHWCSVQGRDDSRTLCLFVPGRGS